MKLFLSIISFIYAFFAYKCGSVDHISLPDFSKYAWIFPSNIILLSASWALLYIRHCFCQAGYNSEFLPALIAGIPIAYFSEICPVVVWVIATSITLACVPLSHSEILPARNSAVSAIACTMLLLPPQHVFFLSVFLGICLAFIARFLAKSLLRQQHCPLLAEKLQQESLWERIFTRSDSHEK